MIAREQLPNDTFELKNIVCQLFDVVEEQKRLIANQNERIETQMIKIEQQSQQIEAQSHQLEAQSKQLEDQSQQLAGQSQKIEEQSQRIDQLTDQLSVLKRHQFGKRSEKNPKEEEKEEEKQTEKTNSPDGYLYPAHLEKERATHNITYIRRIEGDALFREHCYHEKTAISLEHELIKMHEKTVEIPQQRISRETFKQQEHDFSL